MKGLKLFFSALVLICVSNTALTQVTVSINEFPDAEGKNVLFRGYKNLLEIKTVGEEIQYTIENFNLKTSQVAPSDNPNVKRYWITVGSEKIAAISFVKKGKSEPFMTIDCEVSNMPDAVIYLGNVASGGEISNDVNSIRVGVPKGIRLVSNYSLLGFSIYANNKAVTVLGDSLNDESKSALAVVKSGDEVVLKCRVQSKDGITRLIAGTYTME